MTTTSVVDSSCTQIIGNTSINIVKEMESNHSNQNPIGSVIYANWQMQKSVSSSTPCFFLTFLHSVLLCRRVRMVDWSSNFLASEHAHKRFNPVKPRHFGFGRLVTHSAELGLIPQPKHVGRGYMMPVYPSIIPRNPHDSWTGRDGLQLRFILVPSGTRRRS